MINPDTGIKYDSSSYETLTNINMPIITEDNLLFATNNTHVSLVDPLNNRSHVMTLPRQYLLGMHR